MITHANKLICLEHFEIDRNLPKFRKTGDTGDGSTIRMSTGMFSITTNEHIGLETALVRTFAQSKESELPKTWWQRLKAGRGSQRPPAPAPDLVQMSVESFFVNVKSSATGIELARERAKGYELAILGAKAAGQEALLEQLIAGLNAYKMEGHLIELGIDKIVPEAVIVNFYKQVKKGLRLDYVKNFTRTIPQPIIDTKVKADEFGIFDNYVVLHYDPDAKAYAESEAERAAKRDPILFGLIKGKRQLYFIGDWIDAFCDLTLDQFADVLGEQAVQKLT